jgi:hypothetical protein
MGQKKQSRKDPKLPTFQNILFSRSLHAKKIDREKIIDILLNPPGEGSAN